VRIAAYVHPRGFKNPTGVGKHQIHMVSALAGFPATEVSLLAPRGEVAALAGFVPDALKEIPLHPINLARRPLEAMWELGSFPPAERWCGDVDWVYCPFEMFVPTRKAKLAVTVHCVNWFERDLPWYDEPIVQRARRRLGPRFWRIVERADLIFSVSEFLKGRLCELFHADPQSVVVVGNGAEDSFFAAGRRSSPAWEELTLSPYALVVAALESRKGAEYILEFARALRSVEPAARIVVAGGSRGYRNFVEEAAAIPNVELRGYVDTPALVELMRRAVALIVLSRYETFGIPAVEAMACGTPVIAAKFAGLPEVVGEAGIIVDPTRPDEVVDVFRSLLHDESLRERYRSAGLERAGLFTWERCANRAAAAMSARS
jgi:glycosyltransferase involved in cell wall biosynthesis